MYRHSHLTLVVALIAALLIRALPAHAQPERTTSQLQLLEVVEGTLDSSTPEHRYTLPVYDQQIFSVLAWPEGSEELNIQLLDPTGALVTQARPVNLPDLYYSIEAITAAQTGSYEIVVSSPVPVVFELIIIPGYSFPVVLDYFDDRAESYPLNWLDIEEPGLFAGVVNDEYLLQLQDPDLDYSILNSDKLGFTAESYYVEATIRVETGAEYYRYGFAVRMDGFGPIYHGYDIAFTPRGEWGVWLVKDQTYTALSRLQTSPIIDVGNPNGARIGVLIDGYTFTIFYNGQFLGQVTDPDAHFAEGGVAFLASSTEDANGLPLSVYYDNFVVSLPIDLVAESVEDSDAESSTPDIGGILDQSGAGEAGDSSSTIPFDLEGKSSRQPIWGLRPKLP